MIYVPVHALASIVNPKSKILNPYAASVSGLRRTMGWVSPSTTDRVIFTCTTSLLSGASYITSSMSRSINPRNARAPVPFLSASTASSRKRVGREFQLHAFHGHELGELLRQRVLGVGEDGNQLILGQFGQGRHHRQPADEFGNETVIQQILRLGALQNLIARGAGAFFCISPMAPKPMVCRPSRR